MRELVGDEAVDRLADWQSWPSGWMSICGPEGVGLSSLAEWFADRSGVRLVAGRQFDAFQREDIERVGREGLAIIDAHELSDGSLLLAALNQAAEHDQAVALFSRTLVGTWQIEPGDLRSRLRAMSVIQLADPTEADIVRRISLRFRMQFRFVDPDVAAYLARRLPRNYKAVEEFVQHAGRQLASGAGGLNVKSARELLAKWTGNLDLFGDTENERT